MTAKRRSKSGSVLNRQKPRRSGKKGLPLWSRAALTLCASVALFFGAQALWRRHVPHLFPLPETIDWKLELKVDGDSALEDHLAARVLEVARGNLGERADPSLDRAAEAVLKLDVFSRVHVLRRSHDEVVVNVRLRHAVLCIQADKRRLVSEDGEVYGVGGESRCPGPTVTGILDAPGLRYATNGDRALSLTKDDQSLVREAVTLWVDAKDRGFNFTVIDYKKARGFAATIPSHDPQLAFSPDQPAGAIEVALGRAPFDAKLTKLRDILDKLTAKGEQAVRIELDYHGKAFIKSKKM